jgi:Nucleotide modification associated domain 3
MKIAMIRVGVDAGANAGGIQGPLFRHRYFEYIPIPETEDLGIVSKYTYGKLMGRHGRPLSDYFPPRRQAKMAKRFAHLDPEWDTFTYGTDTGGSQAGLRHLEKGDILIFTCGLEGWGDCHSNPGIYLIGYFIVEVAGKQSEFSRREEKALFKNNEHVRLLKGKRVTYADGSELILVKGSSKSRLLKKAVLLSTTTQDSKGKTLKVLSPKMQLTFGDLGGKNSIQRSPTR